MIELKGCPPGGRDDGFVRLDEPIAHSLRPPRWQPEEQVPDRPKGPVAVNPVLDNGVGDPQQSVPLRPALDRRARNEGARVRPG